MDTPHWSSHLDQILELVGKPPPGFCGMGDNLPAMDDDDDEYVEVVAVVDDDDYKDEEDDAPPPPKRRKMATPTKALKKREMNDRATSQRKRKRGSTIPAAKKELSPLPQTGDSGVELHLAAAWAHIRELETTLTTMVTTQRLMFNSHMALASLVNSAPRDAYADLHRPVVDLPGTNAPLLTPQEAQRTNAQFLNAVAQLMARTKREEERLNTKIEDLQRPSHDSDQQLRQAIANSNELYRQAIASASQPTHPAYYAPHRPSPPQSIPYSFSYLPLGGTATTTTTSY